MHDAVVELGELLGKHRLLAAGQQAAVEHVLPDLPDRGKWSVLLPLYQGENGVWQGQALNKSGEIVTVYYGIQLGLLMESEAEEQV